MPSISNERHIAIIGGGVIGASTLYYLSQLKTSQPLRITLIEESASVAPGASGKAGGFLAEDWHGADTQSLASLSFKLHRELAEKDEGHKKWGYRQVDTISLKYDDSKSTGSSKCPPELSWIDSKHVTGASNMGGNGTTAQVTPLLLVQHLVARSKEKENVEVLLGTRAEQIEVNESGHINALIVKNEGGQQKLEVDDVVVATGPWTGKLIKSLLPNNIEKPSFFRSASRITGSRAHSIVIESPKPTTAHCLFTDMHYSRKAGAPEVYCREDGTVYACGGSDSVALPPSADQVKYDSDQSARLIEQMQIISPSHLSSSAGAKVIREQACYLPVSSGSPVISCDKDLGLYLAAGHSCWGILLSLGTGKVIQEMISGKPLSADISALR